MLPGLRYCPDKNKGMAIWVSKYYTGAQCLPGEGNRVVVGGFVI
jgi:hypothetical protein